MMVPKMSFQQAASLFGKNTWALLKHSSLSLIQDVSKIRMNAFILSSLIQVTSRIVISNNSARKAKGTSQEEYRWLEAVKTLFREAGGFILSYMVLRSFQRATIDLFRNYLWVRSSFKLPMGPGVFNKLFQAIFKTPRAIPKKTLNPFVGPGGHGAFFPTFRKQLFAFVRRDEAQLKSFQLPDWADSLFRNKPQTLLVEFHPRRMRHYNKIEPLVNGVNSIARFFSKDIRKDMQQFANTVLDDATMKPAQRLLSIKEQKLYYFFQWFPVLVGSIPALLLSGIALERFSQTKAEPLARRIAQWVQSHKKNALVLDQPSHQHGLDRSGSVPYAKPSMPLETGIAQHVNGPAPLPPTTYSAAYYYQTPYSVWCRPRVLAPY